MPRDSLRATLDDLRAQGATEDRPYLEAMLRRLGYTEREIRSELGPIAEVGPEVKADAPSRATAANEPPTREYRLVVPARESAFWVGDGTANTTDAPFEAMERVSFEEVPGEELEFVSETPEFEEFAEAPEELQEATVDDGEEFAEVTEPGDFQEVSEAAEFQEAAVQEFPVDAPATNLADQPIDTFGGPDVDAQTKTRVRVKRVRAHSREEAESKVASKNRRVIKSIPVDIVERWGGKQ